MPRFRTAAAATLLVIPIVAGGFLLQEPPVRQNAQLLEHKCVPFADTILYQDLLQSK